MKLVLHFDRVKVSRYTVVHYMQGYIGSSRTNYHL